MNVKKETRDDILSTEEEDLNISIIVVEDVGEILADRGGT